MIMMIMMIMMMLMEIPAPFPLPEGAQRTSLVRLGESKSGPDSGVFFGLPLKPPQKD